MEFKVECVRSELVSKGSVFTVRSYLVFGMGRVYVDGIGWCSRRLVGKVVNKGFLGEFVHNSGFDSVDEWWNWVLRFKSDNGFLYEVKKVS